MTFNFKLHQLMWQNLARNPLLNKAEVIDVMYDNQDISLDEKRILKNAHNNCLGCQYSIDIMSSLNICLNLEKPEVLCTHCPFNIENTSSENCLDGNYSIYTKHRKRYIDLCINLSDKLERSAALQQVRKYALLIANYKLKPVVVLENRNGL